MLIEFHCNFFHLWYVITYCVYYYCIFFLFMEQWVYYMCWLGSLVNSSTAACRSDLGGTVGPSYTIIVPSGLLFTFFACFTSFLTHFSLISLSSVSLSFFYSWCFHALVFGKTLVHEFHISYSHTEWYLIFSDSATISAQCVIVAKK